VKNIKVNLDIINAMNPCEARIDNYAANYGKQTFKLIDFLELDLITATDKQWVIKRLPEITQDFWVTYALDCTFNAHAYAAHAYAAYAAADAAAAGDAADAAYAAADAAAAGDAADAADDATYAATNAAYADANAAAERENQIDALIYLLTNWNL